MLKKLTTLLLALLLGATALAEVYEGTTTALSTTAVTAEASGLLQAIGVEAGSHVNAGDALMSLKPERIFAAGDGFVSLVNAREGDAVDGTLLELMPIQRYRIYCTVDKAYQSAASTLVHCGETVYVRCTADGSHRAVGVLTAIDGAEYQVTTIGGELYLGETVYLYRDADFTASQRIGIGTVVANDIQGYPAEGTLTRLAVSEGEAVERGQLLCEVNGGEIEAPVSGIVTDVSVQKGEAVAEGQTVARIVPEGQVCVEIQVDEGDISGFAMGQRVTLTRSYDLEENAFGGTVVDCAWTAQDGLYTVHILPEEGIDMPLGLSVTVRTGDRL